MHWKLPERFWPSAPATVLPVLAQFFALLPAALRPEQPEPVHAASALPDAEALQLLSPPSGSNPPTDGPVPPASWAAGDRLPSWWTASDCPPNPPAEAHLSCRTAPVFYTLSLQDAAGVVVRKQVRVE